jgi:hypothetical protein
MVGSYAGLPNPVDHLFANSYRWLGAQFAKVADRVMWGNDEANFQMVAAYWSGNTAYAGFSTRVPPLKFESAMSYIQKPCITTRDLPFLTAEC